MIYVSYRLLSVFVPYSLSGLTCLVVQRIPFQVVDIIVFLYDIGTHVVDFQICTVERDCQFISWIGPLLVMVTQFWMRSLERSEEIRVKLGAMNGELVMNHAKAISIGTSPVPIYAAVKIPSLAANLEEIRGRQQSSRSHPGPAPFLTQGIYVDTCVDSPALKEGIAAVRPWNWCTTTGSFMHRPGLHT